MSELDKIIHGISQEVSLDLGPGVRERAEAALVTRLSGRDIQALAVEWIVEEARDQARARTARTEREASEARARRAAWSQYHASKAAEQRTAEQNLANREANAAKARAHVEAHWAEMVRRCIDPLDPDRSRTHEPRLNALGHVGPGKPGSASQKNGCASCTMCAWTWLWERKHAEKYSEIRADAYREYEAKLRVTLFTEWTEQLLSSEIAMPDGSRTTWGEATLEQHRLRHDMLAKNAEANALNAARHAQAIDMLRETGAENLAAAVRAVGAAA